MLPVIDVMLLLMVENMINKVLKNFFCLCLPDAPLIASHQSSPFLMCYIAKIPGFTYAKKNQAELVPDAVWSHH